MRLVLEAVVGPLPADSHLNDGDLLPHINQLRTDLPVEWIAVCMQALAQDLDSRPSNGTVLCVFFNFFVLILDETGVGGKANTSKW